MQLWPCLHVICIAVTIDRSRGGGAASTHLRTVNSRTSSRLPNRMYRQRQPGGFRTPTGGIRDIRPDGSLVSGRVCVCTRGAVWRACCWIEKDDDLPQAIGWGWTGGCGVGGGAWGGG